MDPKRREKFRIIADGNQALGVALWHFNNLKRCDELLDWLLRNRLTGVRFEIFMRHECSNSILLTAKEIFRRIERGEEHAPILLGRDYN